MLTLTFGKISKRPNSTKNAMSNTMDVYATLKENVSVEAPIFKINFDPRAYNYVAWAGDNFTRYYYITRHTTILNNMWEVECKLDIPATYRSLYMYGVSGHCVYSTDDSYWDQYFDDMRFTPDYLDPWTHASELFADMSYLYSVDNIFGHSIAGPNMWDITWSQGTSNEYYANTYGDGCYVIQTICKAANSGGMYTYLMPKAGFQDFMNALSGISGYLIDYLKYIVNAIWMPVKSTEILQALGSGHYTVASQIGIGPDVLTLGVTSVMVIPNQSVLSFSGVLDFPVDNVAHPLWMENDRWNTMQLATPGGITDLNLDLCFPCSGRKLCFSTFFDVPTGTCDTKFTYDMKGTSFDNIAGITAYESSINIGTDAMGLITKQGSPLDPLIDVGGSVAPTIGGAIGTAIAGPAGAIAGSQIGGFVNKINPNLNTGIKQFNIGGQVSQLFNNSQPGGITLRMKPWRCRELSEGDWPYNAYLNYCNIHGYPVNKYLDWHDITTNSNKYWVFDEVYVDPNGLTSNPIYTEGLTDDIVNRIIADYKSGIWLE